MKDWGNEKGGWERLNKQLARSKLQKIRVSMTAAREGRFSHAREATLRGGLGLTSVNQR